MKKKKKVTGPLNFISVSYSWRKKIKVEAFKKIKHKMFYRNINMFNWKNLSRNIKLGGSFNKSGRPHFPLFSFNLTIMKLGLFSKKIRSV